MHAKIGSKPIAEITENINVMAILISMFNEECVSVRSVAHARGWNISYFDPFECHKEFVTPFENCEESVTLCDKNMTKKQMCLIYSDMLF